LPATSRLRDNLHCVVLVQKAHSVIVKFIIEAERLNNQKSFFGTAEVKNQCLPKSGNTCGIPPCAMEASDNGVTAIQTAASYTSTGIGVPFS